MVSVLELIQEQQKASLSVTRTVKRFITWHQTFTVVEQGPRQIQRPELCGIPLQMTLDSNYQGSQPSRSFMRWKVALWTKAWKETVPYTVEDNQDIARNFSSIPVLFH